MQSSNEAARRVSTQRPAVARSVDTAGLGDLRQWLETQAKQHNLHWLLAHADDGVIWGRVTEQVLFSSDQAAEGDPKAQAICPRLDRDTLQQARLFAEHAELLLWRDDGGWKARLIEDTDQTPGDDQPGWVQYFDEAQMLWGTHGRRLPLDFTLLQDGSQGLRHAVPLELELDPSDGRTTPPRLWVRHYLNRSGVAGVQASRLCALRVGDPT